MILLFLSINISELHKNNTDGVPVHMDEYVSVTGVVTANFSTNATYEYTKVFVQDETGGIYVYSPSYHGINRGDSVRIYGRVSQWKGITEILLDSFQLIKQRAIQPEPVVIKGEDVVKAFSSNGVEPLEGRLVKIMGVHTNGFGVYERGSVYAFADSTGQFQVFINSYSDLNPHPLDGVQIKRRPYNITGILAQEDTSSPYTWNYRILPRDMNDLESASPLIPVSGPILYKLTDSSVVVRFETFSGCYAFIEYGESLPVHKTESNFSDSIHVFTLNGLHKGNDYVYRIKTYSASDTFTFPVYKFRTPPDTLTGFIFVSMADSRNDWYIPGARVDVYNERFQRIVYNVKEKNPGFILFSGDMIVGADTRDTLLWEWRNWIDMISIVSRSVPLFPAIGNHENGTYGYYNAEEVYRAMFELPANGPSAADTELVYSFDYGFSHIDILDSDRTNNEHRIDRTQREWLDEDLKKTTRPIRIATAHETAFKDNREGGNCLENYPAERDSFWHILVDNGVQAYICGHFHHFNKNYYGRDIPEWMRSVRHIVNGSCGAGIYDESTSINLPHYILWELEPDTGIGYVYDMYNNLIDTVVLYADIEVLPVDFTASQGNGYIEILLKNPVEDRRITYTIQRSVNGSGFLCYHTLTDSEITTGFRDDSVIPGNIYSYRIKTKSLFREVLSDSVSIYYSPEKAPIYLYITGDMLGINIYSDEKEKKVVFVIDSAGRKIRTIFDGTLQKGLHMFRAKRPGDGVYFLVAGNRSIRFVIVGNTVFQQE